MQNIVIDTNVIVSAFISPNSKPAQVVELIADDYLIFIAIMMIYYRSIKKC